MGPGASGERFRTVRHLSLRGLCGGATAQGHRNSKQRSRNSFHEILPSIKASVIGFTIPFAVRLPEQPRQPTDPSWPTLLASKEGCIIADYGDSSIAQIGSKHVCSVARGVSPSEEKLLCILIVIASVLCTYDADRCGLCSGRSLAEAIMA
jgi:hypothetical protein